MRKYTVRKHHDGRRAAYVIVFPHAFQLTIDDFTTPLRLLMCCCISLFTITLANERISRCRSEEVSG